MMLRSSLRFCFREEWHLILGVVLWGLEGLVKLEGGYLVGWMVYERSGMACLLV